MTKRWDEALRSLARRASGPFRVLAFGVTVTPDDVALRRHDLERLLREHGFDATARVFVEAGDPAPGASTRPAFQSGVLDWVAGDGHTVTPVVDVRQRLRELTADLDHFLAAPLREEPAPIATPLVLLRRFEDLGSDAEGISASVEAILVRGAHLIVVEEGVDTRTREGRGRAGLVVRLGSIKASRARERSLQELGRRRQDLKVYGPVPFGYARSGQQLIPVAEQLDAVDRIRELAGRGLTPFETALTLNRERRCWKDGSPWSARRVQLVLRNPLYTARSRREEIA